MAQSGRLWPVQQYARIFSGQYIWPNFPAKRYIWGTEAWQGVAMHPAVITAVCEFTDDVSDGIARWRSEDLGPVGQVTIVELQLVIPDPPSAVLRFQPQIYVNNIPQIRDPIDYEPLAAFGDILLLNIDGYMNPGWDLAPAGQWGFSAERWPT